MTWREENKKKKKNQPLEAHREKLIALTISEFYAKVIFIFASWNKIVIDRFINRIIGSVMVVTDIRQTNVRMNGSWQLEAVPINSINWNA